MQSREGSAMPATLEIPMDAGDHTAIEVWTIDLASVGDDSFADLTRTERDEARGFARERDRSAFTHTRAALRGLLARRLSVAPSAIQFHRDARGRPLLSSVGATNDLAYSVSHSWPMSLVAIRDGGEIGVDIEADRPVPEAAAIARSTFGDEGERWILSHSEAERNRAFLRLWTSLEAYAKALGLGLAALLEEHRPTFAPDGSGGVVIAGGAPENHARDWRFFALDLGDQFVATLAATVDPASAAASSRGVALHRWSAGNDWASK